MPDITLGTGSPEEGALARRLNEGTHTQADVAALRKIMQEKPGQLSKAADLCNMAFEEAIRLVGGNALFAELVRDRRGVLRRELGHADALPAENLRRARGKLRCQDAELVTCDAAAYALPPDVTMVFLQSVQRGRSQGGLGECPQVPERIAKEAHRHLSGPRGVRAGDRPVRLACETTRVHGDIPERGLPDPDPAGAGLDP